MGGLFGAKAPQSQKQQPAGALNVQTSVYGSVPPLVYGKNRVPVNLIHYFNFKAISHTEKQKTGGKGGGSKGASNVTYTYQVAMACGISVGGTGVGVGTVWKNKDKFTASALGLTVFSGAAGQTAWSYLASQRPAEAVPYANLAYIASPAFDLGDSPSLPNLNVEVKGLKPFNAGTNDDALASDIVVDYLTDVRHGAGFGSYLADLDSGSNSFRKYCLARGLFISPFENNQRQAGAFIKEIADICNSAVVWQAGKLNLIPYGDTEISGNGATYTPDLTPQYDIGPDDYLYEKGRPPVKHKAKSQTKQYNHVRIEYNARANDYNPLIVEVKDQADIDDNGLRTKAVTKYKGITLDPLARDVAQIQMQRDLFVVNTYAFRLGIRHTLLEPMDLLTITEPGLGLDRQLVRIIEAVEQDDAIDLVVEEMSVGTAHAPLFNTQGPLGYNQDYNADAGDAQDPLIMNAPGYLTDTGYEMWVNVCGVNSDIWGGAIVWVSDDDVNYRRVGEVTGPARYGSLPAVCPAGSADYDTASTLRVQLYQGALLSGTQKDCDEWRTIVYAGGEWMSYKTATLVGGTVFDLTTLRRAGYGSTRASHAIGSAFAMIDEATFRLPYDKGNVGETIYFKFQSFNVFGGGLQDLGSCTAWPHTIGASELTAPMDWFDLDGLTDDVNNALDGLTGGGNLIYNSDFINDGDGFTFNSPISILSGWFAGGTYAYAPLGVNIIYVRSNTGAALSGGNYIEARVTDLPVEAGKKYIASAYLGNHRCAGTMYVRFYDASDTYISSTPASAQTTAFGGGNLSNFARNYTLPFTAPAGAAKASIWMRGVDNGSSGADSYMFIARPMFEQAGDHQTKPSPWSVSASGIAAKALIAIANAAAAQSTADGKIDLYKQASPPSGSGYGVGDIWLDTSDSNKQHTWDGSSWVLSDDTRIGDAITAAAGAQATADGKVTTFYTSSTPTPEGVGDLWFNTATKVLKRWDGSSWSGDTAMVSTSIVTGGVLNADSYGSNLVTNPNFDKNISGTPTDTPRAIDDLLCDGWIVNNLNASGGRIFMETDQADGYNLFLGWASGVTLANSTGSYTIAASCRSAADVDVQPGRKYYFRKRLRILRNITPPAGVVFLARSMIAWYDKDGANISTDYIDRNTTSVYYDSGDTYTAPSNASTARVYFTLYVRNMTGSDYTPAGLFCDTRIYNCGLYLVQDLDNEVGDGAVYGRYSSDDGYFVGGYRRNGLRFGASGLQLGDARNIIQSQTSGYGAVRTTAALSATSSGVISINAHTVRYGSVNISYNAVSNAITGKAVGSSWVIYCHDPTYVGGTRTWYAAANPETAMNQGDDVVIAGIITIPSSGTGGGGTGGGGTDPGGWCVDYDAVLPDGRFVRDLKVGDMVQCVDVRTGETGMYPLLAIGFGSEECYRLSTPERASVIQSRSTKMDLPGGGVAATEEMLGARVSIKVNGVRSYSTVSNLQYLGTRRVVKPDLGNRMFYAGEDPSYTIATHNIQYKP